MRTCAVVVGIVGLALLPGSHGSAQQSAQTPLVSGPSQPGSPQLLPRLVTVRPIEPMNAPLPSEADSARITRFSVIAYGDTRSLVDGVALQPDHGKVIDAMVAKIKALASTPFPVRFILQSGDAVVTGTDGAQLNVSFSPLIERLTRDGNVPYFFAVGNHDMTNAPAGDPARAL